MTALMEVIERASTRGNNPELAAFEAVASPLVRRTSRALALAISLPQGDLLELMRTLWPDDRDGDRKQALEELSTWPLVVAGAAEWRVPGLYARELARSLMVEDPAVFRLAHEWLARREESREAATEPEAWFIRGRTAFYLAGINSRDAVRNFGDAFAAAPVLDRTAARVWLASLALHQSFLLRSHHRALSFFEGFRLYVSAERRAALPHFESVIDAGVEDVYSAIALHLVGVLTRPTRPAHALRLLRQSVEMSSRIGVAENEVMARHSLVWALVNRAQRSGRDDSAWREAEELADANLQAAIALEDDSLIAWTERSAAAVRWAVFSESRLSPPPGLADEALAMLEDARFRARRIGDLETTTEVVNSAAVILRDERRYGDALDIVESHLASIDWIGVPLASLRRLAQTAGSMVNRIQDAVLRERAEQVLDRIDVLGTQRWH